MMYMRIWIWTGLMFFTSLSFAQSGDRERAVYQQFNKPSKIQWIRHYQGRIDDLNDIAMTLAYDGKSCRGALIYLRSQEKFKLVGDIDKNMLQLEEVDANGQISGHIAAELSKEGIIGEWTNHDRTIGGHLLLHQKEQAIEYPSYCGDNKWIHLYKGTIGSEAIDLILQKTGNQKLRGIAHVHHQGKSYPMVGDYHLDGQFEIFLQDDNGHSAGRMVGQFNQSTRLEAQHIGHDGKRNSCQLNLIDALGVECMEYADYISTYDVTYPKTQSPAFNRWITQLTDEWVAECYAYAQRVKAQSGTIRPDQRASVRAYAWTDIDFYDGQLISGTFFHCSTWSNDYEGQAFNFDLQEGKAIQLSELFIKDFDHQAFVRQYIHDTIDQHALYRDFQFREWLSSASFPYFSIRRKGINFSTAFNPIYGQQHITIPYTQLNRYLQDNHPLQQLINQQ